MKKALCLILLCLLLCGCETQRSPDSVLPTETEATEAADTEPMPLYVPGHPLEQSAPGALRVYPLRRQAHGLLAMGNRLIALCGSDGTELTLLTGEDMTVSATVRLPFHLDADDPSLQIGEDALSYFDPVRKETVVLSSTLKAVSRIAAPEGLKRLHEAHPDVQIYVGHLDRELNENAYICPGLGDAGDRIFGTK